LRAYLGTSAPPLYALSSLLPRCMCSCLLALITIPSCTAGQRTTAMPSKYQCPPPNNPGRLQAQHALLLPTVSNITVLQHAKIWRALHICRGNQGGAPRAQWTPPAEDSRPHLPVSCQLLTLKWCLLPASSETVHTPAETGGWKVRFMPKACSASFSAATAVQDNGGGSRGSVCMCG
jgi:hypothetical protein